MDWAKESLVEQIPFQKFELLWDGGEMSHPFLLSIWLVGYFSTGLQFRPPVSKAICPAKLNSCSLKVLYLDRLTF